MDIQQSKVNIYVDGVVIGFVYGQTFYKTLNSKEHFLQQPPAIAFAETSLDDALECGAIWVQVYASDIDQTYTATIQKIWQDGFKIQRGGFEKQIALPLAKFANTAQKSQQLKLFDE